MIINPYAFSGGGFAAWQIGINIRETSGYVTDGTDQTYLLKEAYPVTRGGVTFGWSGTANVYHYDQNSGGNPRFAGTALCSDQSFIRVDLPSAGTYRVRLAQGAGAGGNWAAGGEIIDDSTVKATVPSGNLIFTNNYSDAVGNTFSAAAWDAGNTYVDLVMTSTIFKFKLAAPAGGAANTVVTHINIERIA